MASSSAPLASQEAETLRQTRGLRALQNNEEGTDVHNLPNGVYGFTFSPAFKEIPIFAKAPYQSFEVHRLKDGSIHTLGYVSPEDKARIDARKDPVEIQLYPAPYQNASAFVSLDLSALSPAKKALTREDGNPFRTTVHPD